MRDADADANVAGARRIVLWGVTGTGKTPLARAAAEQMGVGFVSGDDIGLAAGLGASARR